MITVFVIKLNVSMCRSLETGNQIFLQVKNSSLIMTQVRKGKKKDGLETDSKSPSI